MRKIGDFIVRNKYLLLFIFMGIFIFLIMVSAINNLLESSVNTKDKDYVELKKVENDKLEVEGSYGEKLTVETAKNNKEVIQKFVSLCNEEKYEDAYNLLTKDCKDELFPTMDDFVNDYVSLVFTEKRVVGEELYASTSDYDVYKVSFYTDELSKGKIDDNSVSDYITVYTKIGSPLISVRSLINKTNLVASNTYKGITISVDSRMKYLNYEQVRFTVKNDSKNNICLRTGQGNKTIYMTGEGGTLFSAYGNEISINDMVIPQGRTKTFTIRFAHNYVVNDTIEAITFSDIVENYDAYKEDPESLEKVIVIKISL